jgi:hypothetical protein
MDAISTNDLINILYDALINEPYFDEKIIKPKIKAIITGFRLSLNETNYSKLTEKNDTQRLKRLIKIQNEETEFWKKHLKKLVGDEKIKEYYDMLEKFRIDNKLDKT